MRERTRKSLRDAAAELVASQGLHGTSIEAISERAGYSRGAFYSNYSSKEELFAELLQERIYNAYRELAREWRDAPNARPTARETGERLASFLAADDGRWVFSLWLELLAHAGREPQFRRLAADFWKRTRELAAEGIRDEFKARGDEPPVPPDWIASATIALDVGLAIQHFVDPEAVPLEVYPALFELLFGR
jgi:AcrR family transcriptional regulator